MSFLTRFTPLTARLGSVRATAAPALVVGARSISATAGLQKGPVEATKDTLKKADRAVSDAAVEGIKKGEQAADAIKGTANKDSGELKGQASELAGQGKGKAEEALGSAKGKAEETLGEAKGKAQEAKGKAKEKAGNL
ncbi:hypothetical protein BDV25DRAFT_57412 [Aspergillus avenaceus]|uniref:LEA domain protein n=1 Tax=Aspergillus avenaceus TaxID=36643 RepID=A0A5N6U258_ASPAV|nr:hypothetical protein BDV25DRAFT_57412 [Aspergillus avenaceus]